MFTTILARRRRFGVGLAAAFIALSLPALAVDTGGGGGTPTEIAAPHASNLKATIAPKGRPIDLDAARRLIAKSDWRGAVKLLRQIVVQQPRNADALNLLGYSLRQSGDMKEAEAWYLKALKIKPAHLGANEYLGELYVMTGQMAKAEIRLKAIARICGNTSCEAYQDLSKAIAAKA